MSVAISSELTNNVTNQVAAAQAGDEEAFRWLVERHLTMVRAFIAKFVHDPGAIDDLAQETFVAMHRKLDTFRGDSQFTTWLLGISRNLSLTFLRDRSRQQRREGKVMAACVSQWQLARLDHDDDDDDSQQQQVANLRLCIEQLAPTARSMVQAFYFDQESAEAIADRLNRKGGSIRMALLRIRKTLAACLRKKSETAEAER